MATRVEELLEDLLKHVTEEFRNNIGPVLAAARAEGAEQMRALIKSKVVNVGFHLDRDPGPIVYVPCWVLDNTPEPTGPVRKGQPSQALIDELNELSVFATPGEILQKQMEEQLMEDQQKEDELAEDRKRNEREADVERWHRENDEKLQ